MNGLKNKMAGLCLALGLAGLTPWTSAQMAPVPAPAVVGQSSAISSWPLTVADPSGTLQVFQPQPDKLEGDKLSARSAVSFQQAGSNEPMFGAIWVSARIATDRDARTATILDLTVKRVRFPDAAGNQEQLVTDVLQREVPRLNVTFALDQLMTSLDVSSKEKQEARQLSSTPPKIIYCPTPSTLVLIDGQPRLQPVSADQPALLRVVNTPFIILMDVSGKQFYLKAGPYWYAAPDAAGPWGNVGQIPTRVLSAGNALAAPPQGVTDPSTPAPVNPGQIIVSEDPAELIWTDGQPSYTPLPGNDLLYVTNTGGDIFMEVATQQLYVLLSGRWYRAGSLQGPWEYVLSDKLPPAFAQIPQDSPKANVLASVAGTTVAKEARLDAMVPQTAAVDRNAGSSLSVVYDGEPRFESVQDSPVTYAVNTPEAVVCVDRRYYCCHQAVWYESGIAIGPWAVCTFVPAPIYTLPPSCPVYNVRYCYVYDSTPEVVYCGYLPGYTGCYVFGPTVVFGTGYYYHGWYDHHYYPRPYTWGFSVRYDVSINTWGFGAGYRYDRHWLVSDGDYHGWWGPRGYIDYHELPRDRAYFHGDNVHFAARDTYINRLNVYNRTDNIRRNVIVNRNTYINNVNERGGRDVRGNEHVEVRHEPIREERGGAAERSRGENNVYAGHDGTIYRRTNEGWEQHSGQGWQKLNTAPESHGEVRSGGVYNSGHETPRGNEGAGRDVHVEDHRAENHPSEPARAERHDEPAKAEHSEPARVERHDEPAKSTPRESDRVRSGSHEDSGRTPPGLEADHAARERGVERSRSVETHSDAGNVGNKSNRTGGQSEGGKGGGQSEGNKGGGGQGQGNKGGGQNQNQH